MQVDTIQIKFITPAETYVVRHPVLRVGKPVESCKLEGDENPTTFHLGAYMDGQLVGVVSMLIQEYSGQSHQKSYQLRGMAVLASKQGRGIGAQLIAAAEEEVTNRGGDFIWMNARLKAVNFYTSLGYTIDSPLFEIEKIGPHYVMVKELS